MGNYKTLLQTFRAKQKFIIVILIILTLCTVLLLASIDLDGLLRFSDRLAVFPTVEAAYRQIAEKIHSITADTLIKINSDFPLELMRRLYAGCIRGGFSRMYGANRPYDNVLADYEKAFREMGWEKEPDRGPYSGYSTKTAVIVLNRVDPSSPDYPTETGRYQTVYDVFVRYADPALMNCIG